MSRSEVRANDKKIFIFFRRFVAVPALLGVAVLAGCAASGPKGVPAADAIKKAAPPGYRCKDTDGGLNPAVRGKVTFGKYDYEDTCATGGERSLVNRVVAEPGDVLEFSCYDDNGNPVCTPGACPYSVLKCRPGETCYRGKCGPPADNPDLWPGNAACEDSDNGRNYYERGRVKYRFRPPNDRVAQYLMDECLTGTELREGYCADSGYRVEVKRCEYVCACGRCFREGEKIDCRAGFRQYCNTESCYVIQKDIGDIKFISQNKENDHCIATRTCEAFVGRYAYDDREIIARIELNADLDFRKLTELVKKRHDAEPGMTRIDNTGGEIMVVDEPPLNCPKESAEKRAALTRPLSESEQKALRECEEAKHIYHLYWASDRKVIYVKMHSSRAERKKTRSFNEFLGDYLRVHPSDVQAALNPR